MSDVELIQAVLGGDREAYGKLIAAHQVRVYRLCFRVCGNAADAECLAHDALVEAYLKLDRLRDPARFGPWLRTIALNLCRAWYRQRQRGETADLEDAADVAAEEPRSHGALYAGLARLSKAHRLALVLHYWEGLSYAEVARFLDIPAGTVMSRLSRARDELKRLMRASENEEDFMPPEGDIGREVEAEIRVLLSMFRDDPSAKERLSIVLTKTPERLLTLLGEGPGDATLDDLATVMRRVGRPGIEVIAACAVGGSEGSAATATDLLRRFVASSRPGAENLATARIAPRGLYILVDALVHRDAAPRAKAGLLLELLLASGKSDQAALLFLNALTCCDDDALPLLLERFWAAGSERALFRQADVLHALCRTGTRFGEQLLAPLSDDDAARRELALAGVEALARTLHPNVGAGARWIAAEGDDSDEHIAVDRRHRRKWAMPLHADRDPEVLARLAEAAAALAGDETAEVRERAIRTVGLLRSERHEAVAVAALGSAHAGTRAAAIRALADIGSPRCLQALARVCTDASEGERLAAIEALGALHDPATAPMLAGLLHDDSATLRKKAWVVLQSFGPAGCLAALDAAGPTPQWLQAPVASLRRTAARKAHAEEVAAQSAGAFRMADVVRGENRPANFLTLEDAILALPGPGPFDEIEITRLIGRACFDYSSARRFLVEEGLVERERGMYTLTEMGEVVWRVERFIAQGVRA